MYCSHAIQLFKLWIHVLHCSYAMQLFKLWTGVLYRAHAMQLFELWIRVLYCLNANELGTGAYINQMLSPCLHLVNGSYMVLC